LPENPVKLVLATGNLHKLKEFQSYFSSIAQIISPREVGIDLSVEETGQTFQENAQLKSRELFSLAGIPTIADDSGLCVNALGGRPGIFSARYGGSQLSDKDRALLLLKEMEGRKDRKAWFECAISFTNSAGTHVFNGKCEGEITLDYDETGGNFGYDPVFYYSPLGKRFSQLTAEEKNAVSHRGKAMHSFLTFLQNL